MIYWFETDDRVLNRRECLTRGDAFLHTSVCSFAYVTRPVTFAELSLEAGNQHRVFEIKKKKKIKTHSKESVAKNLILPSHVS